VNHANFTHGYRLTFAIEPPRAKLRHSCEVIWRESKKFGELSVRTKGKITSWNDDKGYGFITPLTGGKQIFIHISAFGNRNRRPELDDVVTYSVAKDEQGRLRAANATLAGDKLTKKEAKKSNTAAILFAALFMVAVAISALTGNLSAILLAAYVALSLVTFIAYAFDKSAARRGTWRTSEGTLLFLGLAGG
jgi:cold shock CspA family protein